MNNEKNEVSKGRIIKPILLVLTVLTLFLLANLFDFGEKVTELKSWIEGLGALGPVVFILIYIAISVAAIPGSPLTILAGAIFGAAKGIIVVVIGATLGATLAFLISRFFARSAVENWLLKKPTFLKLDQMTEDHGSIIVAITRLVPIFPYNLLNYGFGLTKVSFSTYFILTFICMIPGTALYVIGTDAVVTGLSEGRIPWVLILILILVFIALTFFIRVAKRSLKKKEGEKVIDNSKERENK
jgi:uncharacterized membrane protein YdjX (TVP38/TMEM64 family)